MENSISNHFADESGYRKEPLPGHKQHESYWDKVGNKFRETFSKANIEEKDIPDISFNEEAKYSPEPDFIKSKS
jgi:hypothetical protein